MNAAHTQKGFTLVETLVAITIVMIAIVGPFYSVQQAIMASYVSRDELIASSLAQEGAEYIYWVRDNNYLTNQDWLTRLGVCTQRTCIVDPPQDTINYCSGTCPVLNLSTNGLYTQLLGSPATRFTRTITISQMSGTEVKVNVQVTWTSHNQPYVVKVTENLYNWL